MKNKKYIFPLIFLMLIVWISTFNTAYINGDDIEHLSKHRVREIFLPIINFEWIPNRLIDWYGRSMLTQAFDLYNSFLNKLFGIPPITTYKLFNASLLSVSVAILYATLLKHIKSINNNLLAQIYLISVLMLIVTWKNQVFFIAYQLPSILIIIYLLIIDSEIRAEKEKNDHITLFILGFITAFSIELHALFLLIINIFSIVIYRELLKKEVIKVLALNTVISVFSLSMAFVFSERVSHSKINSLPYSFFKFSKSTFLHYDIINIINKYNILLFIILTSIIIYTINKINNKINFISELKKIDNFYLFSFLIYTFCLNFVVNLTGNNYFNAEIYPWGGLSIIPNILLSIILLNFINKFNQYSEYYYLALIMLLIILLSSNIHRYLQLINHQSNNSSKVEMVYQRFLMQEKIDREIDTKLNLKTIPSEELPFPINDSPEWFKDHFKKMIEFYYGTNENYEYK